MVALSYLVGPGLVINDGAGVKAQSTSFKNLGIVEHVWSKFDLAEIY